MSLPAISAISGVAPCRALVSADRRHAGRQARETLPGPAPAPRSVAVAGGAEAGYRAAAALAVEPPGPEPIDRRGLADFFVRGLAPSRLGRVIDTYA